MLRFFDFLGILNFRVIPWFIPWFISLDWDFCDFRDDFLTRAYGLLLRLWFIRGLDTQAQTHTLVLSLRYYWLEELVREKREFLWIRFLWKSETVGFDPNIFAFDRSIFISISQSWCQSTFFAFLKWVRLMSECNWLEYRVSERKRERDCEISAIHTQREENRSFLLVWLNSLKNREKENAFKEREIFERRQDWQSGCARFNGKGVRGGVALLAVVWEYLKCHFSRSDRISFLFDFLPFSLSSLELFIIR